MTPSNGMERLSPEEGDLFKTSMTHARKQDPVRDALAKGDVIFLAEAITSGRAQTLRYWAKAINKKIVMRSGDRRDVSGTYVWLVDR